MGGGGLRILPHKSWNVWNYENRERVRRDEEQAQREADEKRARAEYAEQEHRLEVLRARSRATTAASGALAGQVQASEEDGYRPLVAPPVEKTDTPPTSERDTAHGGKPKDTLAPAPAPAPANHPVRSEHVNFFRDAERAKAKGARRGDADRGGKSSKGKGKGKGKDLTPYLGLSVYKAKEGPWYQRDVLEGAPEKTGEARVKRRADSLDPLQAMAAHLRAKKQVDRDRARDAAQATGSPGAANVGAFGHRGGDGFDRGRRFDSHRLSPPHRRQGGRGSADEMPHAAKLRLAMEHREVEERRRVASMLRGAGGTSTETPLPDAGGYSTHSRYHRDLRHEQRAAERTMRREQEIREHHPLEHHCRDDEGTSRRRLQGGGEKTSGREKERKEKKKAKKAKKRKRSRDRGDE